MDANIKTAASLLRNASNNLQNRIRELQSDENTVHSRESQEERSIRTDKWQTEMRLAEDTGDAHRSQYLVKHLLDLRKRRQEVKKQADAIVSNEEKEIRSLQDQVNKLNELARMLEMWH